MAHIELRSEHGDRLDAIAGFTTFVRLVDRCPDSEFKCLQFLDGWGDTIFNPLQCAAIVDDLDVVARYCRSDEERALVRSVRNLAERGSKSKFVFLYFLGD